MSTVNNMQQTKRVAKEYTRTCGYHTVFDSRYLMKIVIYVTHQNVIQSNKKEQKILPMYEGMKKPPLVKKGILEL